MKKETSLNKSDQLSEEQMKSQEKLQDCIHRRGKIGLIRKRLKMNDGAHNHKGRKKTKDQSKSSHHTINKIQQHKQTNKKMILLSKAYFDLISGNQWI